MNQFFNNLFFPVLSPYRLALLRIATGLFSLWYIANRYGLLMKTASVDPTLFAPVGLAAILSGPLSPGVLEALYFITLATNAAFLLGWQYRYTAPAFAGSLLFLLCYRNSFSMIYHNDNAMVMHILVMALAPAADVLAVGVRPASTAAHWRYGWPVQLVSALTLATYFLAGFSKIAGDSGWGWVSGESLRSQIAVDAVRKALLGESTSALAYALYDHLWLFTFIGVLSLVVELGAPVALLSPRLGMVWAANAFVMHWGIFALMSITFRYQMLGVIFLSFLPLERLVEHFSARALPEPESPLRHALVIFDGRCRFCRGQMQLLQWLDVTNRLRYLSLHDSRVAALVPGMTQEALMREMVVLTPEGKTYAGAGAVRYLFGALPALWVGWPLISFPGSLPVWERAYRAVARRRYALAGIHCEDGSCDWKGQASARS